MGKLKFIYITVCLFSSCEKNDIDFEDAYKKVIGNG